MKALKKLLAWWNGQPPKQRSLRAITEAELLDMFRHAPGTPGWHATLAVLELEAQEQVEAVLEDASRAESEAKLRYGLGAAAGLLRAREALQEWEERVKQEKEN